MVGYETAATVSALDIPSRADFLHVQLAPPDDTLEVLTSYRRGASLERNTQALRDAISILQVLLRVEEGKRAKG